MRTRKISLKTVLDTFFVPFHYTKNTRTDVFNNFTQRVKFNDSICFMGGVAHLGINYGNLYKLRSADNSFTISKGIKLGDSPSAMNIHKGVLYIAGHKGFYTIDKNWQVTTIFDNLFWDGLYPTSVVVLDRKNVFVTIRGGYVKINPENKKMTLYKAK